MAWKNPEDKKAWRRSYKLRYPEKHKAWEYANRMRNGTKTIEDFRKEREKLSNIKWINETMPNDVSLAINEIRKRILERDGQFICCSCGLVLSKKEKSYKGNICKKCKNERMRSSESYKYKLINGKKCSKCGTFKTFDMFVRHDFKSGTRFGLCIECDLLKKQQQINSKEEKKRLSRLALLSEIKIGFVKCSTCGESKKLSELLIVKGAIRRRCKCCQKITVQKRLKAIRENPEMRKDILERYKNNINKNTEKKIALALIARRRSQIARLCKNQIDKENGRKRRDAILSWVGCSMQEFIKYIESKFKSGMSWENYGKWHIDHIQLLSWFDANNEEHMKQAWHYTNMRPLWAKENLCRPKRKSSPTFQPQFSLGV